MAVVLNVGEGQAVQIGDAACVRVEHKSGRMVRLIFFTALSIKLLATGLIPPQFTTGISGELRRVKEPA